MHEKRRSEAPKKWSMVDVDVWKSIIEWK
jgi:hypothetical protein